MKLGLIMALFAISFTVGCSDNAVDGGGIYTPAISATVTGTLGEPLADVGVHYIFQLTPTTVLQPLGKPTPTTTIEFDVPDNAVVTLTILRYGTRAHIATLIDHELLAAGAHSVNFDATSLTNGLYLYQLLIEGLPPAERLMALLKFDLADLAASTPLTSTDARGHFSLPTSVLGIGVRLAITIDNPTPVGYVVISDTINLVLTKAGYQTLVVPMVVDPHRNRSMEFTMRPGSTAPVPGVPLPYTGSR